MPENLPPPGDRITDHIRDAVRERRIVTLKHAMIAAFEAGELEKAKRLDEEMRAEINARSPAVVAWMERAKGLRPFLEER